MIPPHIRVLAMLGVIKVTERESQKTKNKKTTSGVLKKSLFGILGEIPIRVIIMGSIMVGISAFIVLIPSDDSKTNYVQDDDSMLKPLPPLPEQYENLEAKSYEELQSLDLPQEYKENLQGWKLSLDNATCETLAKMHRPNINYVVLSYVKYRERNLGC